MKVFIFVLLVGAGSALELFNGSNATEINRYPYQLSMEKRSYIFFWNFHCGAVIIAPNKALTSGRCVAGEKSSNLRLRAGSALASRGTSHYVTNITLHPQFTNTFDYLDNDIAMLTVKEPFKIGDSIKPINLVDYEPKSNDMATVTGFGSHSKEGIQTLSSVKLTVMDRNMCKAAYEKKGYTVSERMICVVQSKDTENTCREDKGSPLVVNGRLAGISSWGFGCIEKDSHMPDVYSNLAYHKEWIARIVSEKIK